LIANIALDHVDYEQYLAYQDANNISDDDFIYGEEALPIYEVDDDGNYMFYPFSNFDYLCYTSP
jgi:hypothetical protein